MDPHLIANVFMEAFEEEAISISEKKLTCYISFTRKKSMKCLKVNLTPMIRIIFLCFPLM